MTVVDVHLLQLPVALWARGQEQHAALLREFSLLASDPHDVPARLLDLLTTLRTRFGGATTEQEEQLLDAVDAGVDVLPDLVYRMPPEAGPALLVLGQMLDEADAHCRAGQHLLTLAADEELVRFRWWFLESMAEQVAGRPAVPWPQYVRTA